jgi:hypothetical protein
MNPRRRAVSARPGLLTLGRAAIAGLSWIAALGAFGQTMPDDRQCQSMAQYLQRMEASAHTRPEALARARQRYRQQCETTAPADPAAAAASPPPEPTATRAQTPGRFADWNAAVDTACRQSAASGDATGLHTRCAQAKIDRALSEQRLGQAEVDACLAHNPPPSGAATRTTARQRELSDARHAALGGPAYWAWEGRGGCRLVDRVRSTFAEPAGRGSTADKATAQARMCELDPRLPFCAAAVAGSVSSHGDEPYWRWQHQVYSRCAAAPTAGRERDHCARSVVEQALAERRVADAAVQGCRSRWQAGPRDEPEMMAIDQCLVGASVLEQAATSRVIDAAPVRSPAAPPLATQGLGRPDMVLPLYAGELARVPAGAEDLRYGLSAFGKLNAVCGNLGLAPVALQIAQANLRQTQQALQRGLSGEGSMADALTVLGAFNEMLKMLPDCERLHDDPPGRAACLAEQESAFKVQPSSQAVADTGRLLAHHGCSSPQILRYSQQLSAWLLQPDASRGTLAGLDKHPQAAALNRLFDNCRSQAGAGTADAWCGCYVRGFASAPRGSRFAPAEVLDAAAASAFIGGPQAWYAPPDIEHCQPQRQAIERWRRDQMLRPLVTACLLQQQPAQILLRPDLQACRYQSAAGTVELRAAQCPPRLHAHEWGGEAVACR